MSEPRKSAVQTEARRRAREQAAAFRAREDKLESLAVDFLVANAAVEAIDAELERSIAALRERAQRDAEKERTKADAAVQEMLGLGITRSEVASRLGIPTRQVRVESTASKGTETEGADEADEHGEGESGHGHEG